MNSANRPILTLDQSLKRTRKNIPISSQREFMYSWKHASLVGFSFYAGSLYVGCLLFKPTTKQHSFKTMNIANRVSRWWSSHSWNVSEPSITYCFPRFRNGSNMPSLRRTGWSLQHRYAAVGSGSGPECKRHKRKNLHWFGSSTRGFRWHSLEARKQLSNSKKQLT